MSDPRAEIALRTATTHTRPARRRAFSIRLGVCLLALVAYPTGVHADDVQLWTVGRVDHRLTDTWAGQLLVRFRFDEDISQAKDFMLRTYSHWELGKFDAGFGYDYLYSFITSETSENRPFQTAEFRWLPFGKAPADLTLKNRLRLDERFITGVDGVIPRLRYRLRGTRGLGRGWYLAVSNEVFFNLIDRGSGPVYGFEQNRLRFAPGFRIVPGVRLEFGYEWQLSAGRDRGNINNHVLFFTLSGAPKTFQAGRGD